MAGAIDVPNFGNSKLGQALSGFAGGYNMGHGIGGDIVQGMAKGRAAKAEGELDDYINSLGDSLNPEGGVPVGGATGQSNVPTTRDLVESKRDLDNALRMAGDADWANRSREMWAEKLTNGYNGFITAATNALESGDMDRAKQLAQRGFALLPNSKGIKIDTNDKGEWVVKAYSEATDDITDEKVIDPRTLPQYMLALKDPKEMAAFHEAQLEAGRAAEEKAYARAQEKLKGERDDRALDLEEKKNEATAAHQRRTTDVAELGHVLGAAFGKGSGSGGMDAADWNAEHARVSKYIDDMVEKSMEGMDILYSENPEAVNDMKAFASLLMQGKHGGNMAPAINEARSIIKGWIAEQAAGRRGNNTLLYEALKQRISPIPQGGAGG